MKTKTNSPKTHFVIMEYISKADGNGNRYFSCSVLSTVSGKSILISGEPAGNVRHYIRQAMGNNAEFYYYPGIVDYSSTLPIREYNRKTANYPQYRNPESLKIELRELGDQK